MARALDRYLDELLPLFWLRPETALWRACDCLLMESVKLPGRSADLGCGDGTLSFVMAGGRFPKDYDVFKTVAKLRSYGRGSDIFNAKARGALKTTTTGLHRRFSWAVDHKDGLISKAARLGLYEKTLVHDLNKPLPFEVGSLDSAFSNILYWLEDADAVLKDWRRVLAAKGRLALFVPDHSFPDKAWLYYRAPHEGRFRHLNYLDRGYSPLIKHCYSAARWEKIFDRAGYRVVEHRPYLSDAVMDIWNVGTRPIAHLLIDMAGRLDASDRLRARKLWVDFFTGFFSPILRDEMKRRPREGTAAFHFYVLEKRS